MLSYERKKKKKEEAHLLSSVPLTFFSARYEATAMKGVNLA